MDRVEPVGLAVGIGREGENVVVLMIDKGIRADCLQYPRISEFQSSVEPFCNRGTNHCPVLYQGCHEWLPCALLLTHVLSNSVLSLTDNNDLFGGLG